MALTKYNENHASAAPATNKSRQNSLLSMRGTANHHLLIDYLKELTAWKPKKLK